ncbi:MAG: minor capsid protein, partial [Treponema sp.]|nr:minor capsid protein [Candidatus Treponema caballi]
MAEKAIRPHLETVLNAYLESVKNADKAALEKPFTIENDAEFVHNVEQLIASSYMLGIYHADEETGKNVNAADTDIPPIPFTEAVNFLKEKVPMTKEAWSSLEPKIRFRAFTVAKLGSAKTIDVARQQLIGALEDGSGYAETWQRIKDTLQDEAKSLTPGYWENVFRTNTQSAYIAGKLEQYEKNGVAAYQLMVIDDDRTSKICRNLLNNATGYGLILPVNHQFWKTYGFPPYHYQCRTSISGLKKSQLGKDGNNVDNISMNELRRRKFKPIDGFGGNPNFWGITNSQIEQAEMYGIKEEIVEKIKITIPEEYKDFNFIKEIKENDLFDFLEDYNKASKVARDFIFKYGKQMNMDCYINGRG